MPKIDRWDKLCGEGSFPKTFLLRGQPAKGTAI